ncbi:MAG: BatA domain-containing protein [Planctomycetota bacterium]
MSLDAPEALLLLLPLGALLWWRWRHHGREERRVSSLDLWRELLAEAPPPRRRRRPPMEALLELLLGAAVVLALAGPRLASDEGDRSPSSSSTPARPCGRRAARPRWRRSSAASRPRAAAPRPRPGRPGRDLGDRRSAILPAFRARPGEHRVLVADACDSRVRCRTISASSSSTLR